MKIDGACHCGDITYEAEIDPERVVICHCTDCQTLSGTAFRTAVAVPGKAFRILTGKPREYLKRAETGADRVQAFCPVCGTQIYAADPGDSAFYFVRAGTARQRAELIPRLQVWCRSRLSWLDDLAAIPSVDTQPPIARLGRE